MNGGITINVLQIGQRLSVPQWSPPVNGGITSLIIHPARPPVKCRNGARR